MNSFSYISGLKLIPVKSQQGFNGPQPSCSKLHLEVQRFKSEETEKGQVTPFLPSTHQEWLGVLVTKAEWGCNKENTMGQWRKISKPQNKLAIFDSSWE